MVIYWTLSGHLTARSDVYGFGVVLLEMLIGRKAVDKSRPSREHNLVDWARPLLNNNKKLTKILDPRMEGQYSVKTATKVANLAYQCLCQNPKGRPLMSQVVEILENFQAKEQKVEEATVPSRVESFMLYEALKDSTDNTKEKRDPAIKSEAKRKELHPMPPDRTGRTEEPGDRDLNGAPD